MATQTVAERMPTQSDGQSRNRERIAKIEAVLPYLATKADLEKLKSDLTWRIILAMTFLTAIFVAVLELRGTA